VTPAARRRALDHLRAAHRCSERRACGLVGLARSVARYRSRRRDDAELRARLRELAGQHRRFGYLRLHALLRREGLVINRKKTYRLYQAEGLAVRRRPGAGRRSASACGGRCPRGATNAGRWFRERGLVDRPALSLPVPRR
jgi:putative transposase